MADDSKSARVRPFSINPSVTPRRYTSATLDYLHVQETDFDYRPQDVTIRGIGYDLTEQNGVEDRLREQIGGLVQNAAFSRKDWLQVGGIVAAGIAVGATALFSSLIPLATMAGCAATVALLEMRKPRS